ncbi:MAG: DUF3179 domain-containing (seleno)protein [Crenarchaeota archaeon]|nr:DUF3179 domain-containing (seleno)protein [Thermoproteota archaeon]
MNLKVLAPVIVIITILVVLAVSLQLESTAKITRDNLIETVDFGSSELAIMETKGVKHIIPLDKIKGGGPPKDGIPSIDNPIFATVQDSHFMSDSDTVIGLEMNGEAKAYPLFILVWHEIVNDKVVDIALDSKQVTIQRMTGKSQRILSYDYLVLAMGGKTNFFGNDSIEKNSLTIKSLDDAIKIRNHLISMLEDADQETDLDLQKKIMTFVVVGGGFSGVETVGEINDFVRESAKKFYRNIHEDSIRIILVSAGDKILPEIGNLGKYAKQSLQKAGVTIYTDTRLEDISKDIATLSNKKEISTLTVIWAGGNRVEEVIQKLSTSHHQSGRIIVNKQLKLDDHREVFALGDCAYSVDPRSKKPYPPTAQHAIRQAKTVAENLENKINGVGVQNDFIYDTKGSMAKIGRKDGVALLLGYEIRGLIAWLIWKQYYLSTLPTNEKKIRVGVDWFIDMFFPRDTTRLSNIFDEK